MTEKKYLKNILSLLGVFLCLIGIGNSAVSFGSQRIGIVDSGYAPFVNDDAVSGILKVMEIRGADRKVLQKSAEKMRAIDERELRLMSALCERISADNDTVGAEIAFSLLTAMIILS